MSKDLVEKLTALLMETGQAHHQAFIKTDGEDPEWAKWYGEYLANKLPALIGSDLDAGQISSEVVELDKSFTENAIDTHWTAYYADQIAKKYSPA